jgi:23S rRNA (cytidine1920-2'-O)/16S rRNA (cytidine1409-2'-O)-methyltransferase
MKKRLDQFLLDKGIASSRSKAQAIIMAGRVLINEQKIDKAGILVDEKSTIRILGDQNPYVSRGGLKLEKALDEFKADPSGKICLDIGASTGGFTDCLLQRGALKVYAIDVGYGQLDLKIRNDKRVIVIEKTNARNLAPADLYKDNKDKADLAVIDVSFISLSKILPAVHGLIKEDGEVVALVKPQFEAGRSEVGKGGVIKDKAVREKALNNVIESAKNIGFNFTASIDSPIKGTDGNIEFLIYLKKV